MKKANNYKVTEKKEKEKIAVIYARVSTDDQVEHGMSIEVQERVCREIAEKSGYLVLEVLKDEGKSGKAMIGRHSLKRAMDLAEKGEIGAIFLTHNDRLARNASDHLILMKHFEDYGVKVNFVYQQGIDRSTAMGYTADTMMALMSEYFSRNISEKTRKAISEKLKEGWFPGVAPIGYMNVDNPNFRNGEISKKIIVPDPKTAQYIKELFELYATGNYNIPELSDILYEKGFRTRRGNRVHLSILYDILDNQIYKGSFRWGKEFVEKARHQPLVSEVLFDRVQTVLKSHNHYANRSRKHNFLLNGVVRCAIHKDKRYTAEWHNKKSGLRFGYYHCSKQDGCEGRYVGVEALEGRVSKLFNRLKFAPELIKRITEKVKAKFQSDSERIVKNLKSLYSQKNKLFAKRSIAEQKLLSGALTDDEFIRIKNSINNELKKIEAEINLASSKREVKFDIARQVLKLTRDISETYGSSEPNLKKQYLRLFFEDIFASNGDISEVRYSPLFQKMIELNQITQMNTVDSTDPVIITGEMGV